jgi:YegS/Rv2252/BmrU family lipid kinase
MDKVGASGYSEGMKVQLIYNPVAGPADMAQSLAEVVTYLQAQGWQVMLRQTRGSGDATTYAREAAAEGYDLVVAVGGDGTLGEVANGLVGSACTMGVLPVGTGNIWARMMRLPLPSAGHPNSLMAAARVLVEGTPHTIDLGRADNRYFVMWTGIGLDAQIARDVEPHREMRRSLGNLTYVVAAIVQAARMRGTRATVVVAGRAVRQRPGLVVITNAQLYGPRCAWLPRHNWTTAGWRSISSRAPACWMCCATF